jgi:hypothetical protein
MVVHRALALNIEELEYRVGLTLEPCAMVLGKGSNRATPATRRTQTYRSLGAESGRLFFRAIEAAGWTRKLIFAVYETSVTAARYGAQLG